MILTKCVFCGKKHIEYGNRTSYEITTLAQKSSYEMLIMILKDMKIFIKENECDQSLREAISCFCKYSLLICEEEVENKKNGFTDFHGVIFNGVIASSMTKF